MLQQLERKVHENTEKLRKTEDSRRLLDHRYRDYKQRYKQEVRDRLEDRKRLEEKINSLERNISQLVKVGDDRKYLSIDDIRRALGKRASSQLSNALLPAAANCRRLVDDGRRRRPEHVGEHPKSANVASQFHASSSSAARLRTLEYAAAAIAAANIGGCSRCGSGRRSGSSAKRFALIFVDAT